MLATALWAFLFSPLARASSPWDDLVLETLSGDVLDADRLRDKVVLVVNVASFCRYASQYGELQLLWSRHQDRGLVVLGVPCNQFGGQEPGTSKEIKNFCTSRYGVDFPLLAKQKVNGPDRSPLYRWLLRSSESSRDLSWNFEKFLVNRSGEVVARFGSHVSPNDEALRRAVNMALDGAL